LPCLGQIAKEKMDKKDIEEFLKGNPDLIDKNLPFDEQV
jgi:hypothetical protein